MANPIARFTSLTPASGMGKAAATPAPRAKPAAAGADGVEVRLSGQARALLDQIAAARGEAPAEKRPSTLPGSRVNIVI